VTSWTPALSLDGRDAKAPLFVRIAEAVSEDVRRGRLRRGARLPGSRSLAKTLGVDRDTVTAAYRELRVQGWVEPRRARGVFVAASIPDAPPRRISPARRLRAGVPEAPGFAFDGDAASAPEDAPPPPGVIDFGNSSPDLREFPVAEFARAMRRQLRLCGPSLLGYGDPQGHARLRAALASMLSARRGLAATADDVAVVRGSQMALALVARAIVRPGDVVAVESLGYRPAWSAFEDAGARLLSVPVDDEGLDVEALETAMRRRTIRAVYLTPHHHYPTTVTLSAQRRLRLLDAARRHRFAVVEDDYDHEVHYEGRPILPLASVDKDGLVVYVGTMSKTLAPSLRLGYVVAPRGLVRRIASLRRAIDRQGDLAVEAAVADLMEDGTVRRHLHRMQRLYRVRRDVLAETLTRKLGGVLSFRVPSGGMALWANVAPGVDVEAWARRARGRGLALATGRNFTSDLSPIPYLRLGFSSLREDEIREAVRRMSTTV
jgi:GntR family transcriptional regulator/MocR family aminotransferase